jgi:hypothetical protein
MWFSCLHCVIRSVKHGAAEDQGCDPDGGDVQVAAGDFVEHLRAGELVRSRPLKNADEAVGSFVDDLRDFQDFLNAFSIDSERR